MLHGPQRGLFDLSFQVPSGCADEVASGAADIGIVPSIELTRQTLDVIPGTGIACRGAVRSILLVSTRPAPEIRTLAADISSRTSVQLARVVLQRRYSAVPEFRMHRPDLEEMLRVADAALVIGDPALAIDERAQGLIKTDLGSEWKAMTGLPFVYAMWSGRSSAAEAVHVAGLNAARDRGVAAVQTIARLEGNGDPRREQLALVYLRDNLKYGLGEPEMAGLRRFHELAAEQGLVPGLRDLKFF